MTTESEEYHLLEYENKKVEDFKKLFLESEERNRTTEETTEETTEATTEMDEKMEIRILQEKVQKLEEMVDMMKLTIKSQQSLIENLSSPPPVKTRTRTVSTVSGGSVTGDTISFDIHKNSVKIHGGATMANKARLKEAGCGWNRALRAWITNKETGKELAEEFKEKLDEKCIIGEGVLEE